MVKEKRTLLLVVRLANEDLRARALESAPKVKAVVERLSNKDCKLAFITSDGASFAYFMNTDAPAPVIRAELYGASSRSTGGAPLLNADHYLLISVGAEVDGVGFSQAWTWLQHHQVR